MPWKYTEEYYRDYTRQTWNESAEAYVRLDPIYVPFRDALVEQLHPRPGESILDLGTGPGEPALTIASAVGPGGRVLGVDLSERMVELAGQRARSRSLTNASFRVMDCARLELPSSSFDAAVSCFGFQIFTDPEGAASECLRVLRPGGRLAVLVWSTGDRVPLLDVLMGPMLRHAEPDETGYLPSPYETGGPGEMADFLRKAGFRDPRERYVTTVARFASADEYIQLILDGTPLGHSLHEEDPATQQEILREARTRLRGYETDGGVALPATALLVDAHR